MAPQPVRHIVSVTIALGWFLAIVLLSTLKPMPYGRLESYFRQALMLTSILLTVHALRALYWLSILIYGYGASSLRSLIAQLST
jgi:hypothetical protein